MTNPESLLPTRTVSSPGRLVSVGCLAAAVAVLPAASTLAQTTGTTRTTGIEFLPDEGLFTPLLADPYDPAFRQRFVNGSGDGNPTVTMLGITEQGGRIGLLRWRPERGTGVLHVEIAGSVSAQFDLAATHWDLLNTDYTLGFPITFQVGKTSLRVRPYHQSSHFGDEFVRRDNIWIWGDEDPILPTDTGYHASYRFESVELLAAQEWRGWRLYAGGEWRWFVAPWSLERWVGRGGLEHRARLRGGPGDETDGGGNGRTGLATDFVGAVDVRMTENRDWAPGVSVRSGIEVGRLESDGRPGRRLGVLVEYFSGPAPFGQFQMFYDLRYYGGGLYIYW